MKETSQQIHTEYQNSKKAIRTSNSRICLSVTNKKKETHLRCIQTSQKNIDFLDTEVAKKLLIQQERIPT